MRFVQFIVRHLIRCLPATRCYPLKSWLLRRSGIMIHPTARIASSVLFCSSQVNVVIGKDVFIGHEVLISGGDSTITIGDYVDIAPRVVIVSGTHQIDMHGEHSAGEGYSLDIQIEDGVWVGASSTIIGGVTIGKKSIIAAGSTVVTSIPPYVLAAGTPCRPIKKWDPSLNKMVRIL